ncbi:hypothetical protein CEXT_488891 [Caerostris extrusa]|uniref:Uncharacterized protein n=1 Tax=Caerostris extrusa TaxID=172846 RepID=A0AAV4R474_CAEEX|nr:hypothetical protein CEXT_488891 [Caerostris extrusa]
MGVNNLIRCHNGARTDNSSGLNVNSRKESRKFNWDTPGASQEMVLRLSSSHDCPNAILVDMLARTVHGHQCLRPECITHQEYVIFLTSFFFVLLLVTYDK